ncbi:MAG: tRNA uridine-5-carboxymethylaminomethyl(34) synthesis GTPase MnmE [Spirochaetales bacterium]|nr:tRNA uridine-5-carboxymethylaminomethyl(34) synthesis GTPase MnmE [Spirochaetales bacterium]
MKPSDYDPSRPIVAIASALVPQALGIVRLSGSRCLELLAPFFSRPQALALAPGNTLVHGWLYNAPEGTEGRSRLDEVMIAVYRAPKSFTGEDSAEITCHGGPAILMAVFRTAREAGFFPAQKGEFTLRAFMNGKTDLTRSEAIREIIESSTDMARESAANRLSGTLTREIIEIKNLVIHAIAAIGVEIEYPEDEETVKGAFNATPIMQAIERLKILESAWVTERLLLEGVKIVLAGKTNAGKSRFFNALLKEERAIVSDTHGTTRDWLESRIDVDGIPALLYDTAGMRETEDHIEAQGVDRSKNLARKADLVLYLVDATCGLTDEDRQILSTLSPSILVWSKVDLPQAKPLVNITQEGLPVQACIAASAKTGEGIHELIKRAALIIRGADSGEVCAKGEIAPGSERQKKAIQAAREQLQSAIHNEQKGFPLDAVCQDLEESLTFLGEITGEISSADILDEVFSNFCVGK